jgi:hypothetical protein
MTTVRPPRSPVTGTLTRTRPAAAGSRTGTPSAVTGPIRMVSPDQPARSVSADTAARNAGANRASMSVKRPWRARSTTEVATAAGSELVIPRTNLSHVLRTVSRCENIGEWTPWN